MNPILKKAAEVLELEAHGILGLIPKLDESFVRVVDLIYRCEGRVVVSGIGKSGIVGRKIVATLNSTGTPSLFLHPVEALHGDLGMVSPRDVILILSNSGETEELKEMLIAVKGIGAAVVAFTGNPHSCLAAQSDIVIDVGVEREACTLGLAPTTSTTAALAMGDALSVVLTQKRNFGTHDFRRVHPAGALGKRLNIRVKQIMLTRSHMPSVVQGASLMEATREIDRLNLGFALVLAPDGSLKGIITDGDIRRAVLKLQDLKTARVEDVMTPDPVSIHENQLAIEALNLMEQKGITSLVIVNSRCELQGVVHLHDLLGRGEFRFTHV